MPLHFLPYKQNQCTQPLQAKSMFSYDVYNIRSQATQNLSKSCNFEKKNSIGKQHKKYSCKLFQIELSDAKRRQQFNNFKWSTIQHTKKICQKATKATAIRKKGLDRKAAKKSALVKWKKKFKVDKWFGTFVHLCGIQHAEWKG